MALRHSHRRGIAAADLASQQPISPTKRNPPWPARLSAWETTRPLPTDRGWKGGAGEGLLLFAGLKGSMAYRRVLLKLSGEALMGAQGYGIDPAIVQSVARDVAAVVASGTELAIVVGGGNIFRGLKGSAAGMDRATADYVGMLATVMNAITLQDGLERAGVPTRVQSAISMQEVAEPYIRRKAIRHMEKGRVVIFAAGTGNPFFTTDTTAALRAAEIGADVVFKATKVDGVYDRDPARYPDAVRYESLTFLDVLSGELEVMDGTAIALCKDNAIPIVVFDLFGAGNIGRAVAGESIGTRIVPSH